MDDNHSLMELSFAFGVWFLAIRERERNVNRRNQQLQGKVLFQRRVNKEQLEKIRLGFRGTTTALFWGGGDELDEVIASGSYAWWKFEPPFSNPRSKFYLGRIFNHDHKAKQVLRELHKASVVS